MSVYLHTLAITINRKTVSDNDRIFTFYTRDYGKVSAMVKSGKKISSRLAGHLEPFVLTDLNVARGHRFARVTGARTVQRFDSILSDYYRTMSAGLFLRLYDRLVRDGTPDPELFDLLLGGFHALESAHGESQISTLNAVFALQFLTHMGYRPQLRECTVCRKSVQGQDVLFVFATGGAVCAGCEGAGSGARLSAEDAEYIESILQASLSEILQDKIIENKRKKLNIIASKFLEYHRH